MKKLVKKLKTTYDNMHLQSKLMLTYLIIISIPMIVIALFFYGRVYSMIVADTIQNEQQDSARTAPAVEQALEGLLDDYKAIQNLPFYQEILGHDKAGISGDIFEDSAKASDFLAQTDKILKDSAINHLRIYMDIPTNSLQTLNQSSGGIFSSMASANNTYWKGIFSGTGLSALHCPSFYLSSDEMDNYGNMAYITRRSFFMDGETRTCYTAAYYSSDTFLDILKAGLPDNGSVSYLINDRDAIIATTNPALSSTYYLNYDTIQESFMSSNNFLQRTVLEEEIYAGMYNIRQSQWYMVVVIPSKPLVAISRQMMMLYVFLFLCCIVVALFIAVIISRSITKRIAMVTRQMARVRTGPPIPLKEPREHDEIGDLINTYNYMSGEMNHLLIERAKSAEELRIAEFNSLQAQMNPHFLYNTMDMINWMAAQGRTGEIGEVVQNLSRFYRLTLSKKESISTIEDEIEHVAIYIRLQNKRFHNNIDFVPDIPDELLEYQIPKLTLQPVVENAILHGIMEKEEKKGCIVLTGWLENNQVVLMISDDGVGIPSNKLDSILSGDGQSKTGSNIAIYNTHHRLQVLYGTRYGLSYHSLPGKGTDVTINLPAKKKGESIHHNAMIQTAVKNALNNAPAGAVESQAVLNYSRKLSNDTHALQNVHRISETLPANESLCILLHTVTEDFPSHSHNYYEMVYCCVGSIVNCIDGQELIQTAGDILLLNPCAVHEIKRMDSDALLINFTIWPELLERFSGDVLPNNSALSHFFHGNARLRSNYLYFPAGHNLKIQSLLSAVIQEYAGTKNHHSAKTDELLGNLFKQLSANEEYSYYGPSRESYTILQYIKEHCTEESLEKIAGDVQETPQSLTAYIKKHTGRALLDIIEGTKAGRVIDLLEQPDMNIYDIAAACGYETPEELANMFQKQFHILPEEYRKEFL